MAKKLCLLMVFCLLLPCGSGQAGEMSRKIQTDVRHCKVKGFTAGMSRAEYDRLAREKNLAGMIAAKDDKCASRAAYSRYLEGFRADAANRALAAASGKQPEGYDRECLRQNVIVFRKVDVEALFGNEFFNPEDFASDFSSTYSIEMTVYQDSSGQTLYVYENTRNGCRMTIDMDMNLTLERIPIAYERP